MRVAVILAFLIMPLAASGRETAYQALRIVGAERSQALLNTVIEVKGRNGAPQPALWLILINDPLARGGVREVEVAKGHITSERTPLKAYSGQADGAVLNFSKLNLDSEGAFSVAEAEARTAKLGFYGADYLLRCGENGAPVWVLELLDEAQHRVGSVTVAADTGKVISKTFDGVTSKGSWAAGGGLKGRLIRFSDTMGRSFRNAGDKLQEFWDGEPVEQRKAAQ